MNETHVQTLSADDRLDWLRLIRSDNVGPITFYQLLERFGTAGAALKGLPDLARQGGRSKKTAGRGQGQRRARNRIPEQDWCRAHHQGGARLPAAVGLYRRRAAVDQRARQPPFVDQKSHRRRRRPQCVRQRPELRRTDRPGFGRGRFVGGIRFGPRHRCGLPEGKRRSL